MSISRFFQDKLLAPLKNRVWSWGAVDASNRVFLSVWKDDIRPHPEERIRLLRKKPTNESHGYRERQDHINAIRHGATAFGILCTAKDPSSRVRAIARFDETPLLVLGAISEDDEGTFARIIARVPLNEVVLADSAPNALASDLAEIISDSATVATEKKALVDARVGQGAFRSNVLRLWASHCCVTGSSTLDAIRASHIKPWRASTNEERLDPNNGLPFVASLDALFDAGLISFEASGRILISSKLAASERRIFGLAGKTLTKTPRRETARYLLYHRQHIFLE